MPLGRRAAVRAGIRPEPGADFPEAGCEVGDEAQHRIHHVFLVPRLPGVKPFAVVVASEVLQEGEGGGCEEKYVEDLVGPRLGGGGGSMMNGAVIYRREELRSKRRAAVKGLPCAD